MQLLQPTPLARNGALLQGQQRTQFRRPPEMPAVGIKRPAAHAGDALGLARCSCCSCSSDSSCFCCSISVCVPTMRRAGHRRCERPRGRDRAPTPLAIGLAETELCAVLLAVPAQVLVERGTHLHDVLAVHACQHAGRSILAERGRACDAVTGNVPVPQAVAGTVQRQLPAPASVHRHRLGDAQGEGQQVAGAVVHRTQVAVVVPARAARQRCRRRCRHRRPSGADLPASAHRLPRWPAGHARARPDWPPAGATMTSADASGCCSRLAMIPWSTRSCSG